MKKVFIVTGELSGDLHASKVVRELKQMIPDIEIVAVGGKNLQAEGVKLFSDHSKMNVVGLDALKAIASHINLGKTILDYLKNEFKPDLVLLIDYGGFNLRLAEVLHKNGIPVYYYISPQIWASRKGRINKIKKFVSKMMLILPFEEEIHRSAGVNAEYVGHPLISQLPPPADKGEFIKANNLDPNKKIVGLFPGSRKNEINTLLPIFLQAANLIHVSSKKVQFCLTQASNIDDSLINKYIQKYDKNNQLDIRIIKNQNHAALSCCDAVILASGTVTLEAALYKTSMVVSYKVQSIVYFLYLMLRYIEFLSLPNIIAGKKIVEEMLQYRAKPDLIASEILSILHNCDKREEILQNLSQLREKLGNKVAAYEVAKNISEFLASK